MMQENKTNLENRDSLNKDRLNKDDLNKDWETSSASGRWKIVISAGLLACFLMALTLGLGRQLESRGIQEEITEMRSLTVESWDQDYSKQGWGWRLTTDQDDNQGKKNSGAEKYASKTSGGRAYREAKLIKGSRPSVTGVQAPAGAQIFAAKFSFYFPGKHLAFLSPPVADRYTVEKFLGYVDEAALIQGIKQPSCFQNKSLGYNAEGTSQAVECIRGVRLPGQVQSIVIWVLSRNYQYTLQALLENAEGKTDVVTFGDLDFTGWQEMVVKIPAGLEQSSADASLGGAGLILKRLQLRRKSNAKAGVVHLFFDDLKALTNIKRRGYSGREVTFDRADCEQLNKENQLIGGSVKSSADWPTVDCSKQK